MLLFSLAWIGIDSCDDCFLLFGLLSLKFPLHAGFHLAASLLALSVRVKEVHDLISQLTYSMQTTVELVHWIVQYLEQLLWPAKVDYFNVVVLYFTLADIIEALFKEAYPLLSQRCLDVHRRHGRGFPLMPVLHLFVCKQVALKIAQNLRGLAALVRAYLVFVAEHLLVNVKMLVVFLG